MSLPGSNYGGGKKKSIQETDDLFLVFSFVLSIFYFNSTTVVVAV